MAVQMLERAFFGYSQRVFVSVLAKRLGVHFAVAKCKARTVRALWFFRASGGGWLSLTQLGLMGAGLPKRLLWTMQDGMDARWIERMGDGPTLYRYRITPLGLLVLAEADNYIREEYIRSCKKMEAFRLKHGITSVPDVPKKKKKG